MSNHLPDLGWVDFIVCHSTVCLAELAEELGGTSKSKSSPTQGPNSIEKNPTEKPTENPTEKPTEIPYTKKKSKNG